MDRPIRIAVVGCGWAGGRHIRAFAAAGAELRWAVDVDRRRAETAAAGWPNARVASDYRDALADSDLDAVDVCLPHDLHSPVAVDAARAGKHVLCEKPLAATLEEADRMIEAANAAGVVFMVAENVRFNPAFRKVRELLDVGVVGKPALIQMTRECYLRRSILADRPWFLDRKAAAGGIMMSGGVHDFETLRMLVGEVASVYSLRAPQRFLEMEGDDTSVALVRFRNGAVGTLVESFIMKSLVTAAGPEVHTLRIDGELGSLLVTDEHTIRVFSERAEYLPGGVLAQHDLYVADADTFTLEIAHFVECIRLGREPITSGRSQRKPLEAVLAAYRSMATGQPVLLS